MMLCGLVQASGGCFLNQTYYYYLLHMRLHGDMEIPNLWPAWCSTSMVGQAKPTLPPADAQIRPSHSPGLATPDAASFHRRQQQQQQPPPMHNAANDGEQNGPHGHGTQQQRRRHGLGPHPHPHRSRAYRSGPLRWALAVLFTVLAILVLAAAVGVLVVVLVLQPRAPYVAVQTARLQNLVYDQQGVLDSAELELEVRATNVNAHAAVSFSELELRLSFHGTVIAVLRADPFAVPPKGVLPLGYVASSSAVPLDGPGRAAMEGALGRGVVPFRVNGQALTRWKVGGLVAVKYWTRLACQIRFFWPNGTALHFTCNSKSRSRY